MWKSVKRGMGNFQRDDVTSVYLGAQHSRSPKRVLRFRVRREVHHVKQGPVPQHEGEKKRKWGTINTYELQQTRTLT